MVAFMTVERNWRPIPQQSHAHRRLLTISDARYPRDIPVTRQPRSRLQSTLMAKHTPRFLQIVNDAKSRIRELTVRDVQEKVARREKFHLVDVREESEWAAGHLPNAMHLSKGVIERDVETKIPDATAEIVLYCGGGYRSALVADNLQKMGYTNVYSMDGGFRGWKDAGFPLEK
jgi:rhodanese-related sulfurtransferase